MAQQPTPKKKPTAKAPVKRTTDSAAKTPAKRTTTTTTAAKKPGTAPAKKAPAKKKKSNGHGRTVLMALMVVLILVATGFIYYLGKTVYTYFKEITDNEATTESVDPVTYETTPVAQSKKVGYYVIGLMGADGDTSATEMLSIACFDKEKKTIETMQIPRDTYLGADGTFKVKKACEVFANPQDYDWCESCRGRVYAPEKSADGTHTVCNGALTKKTGSATVNLVEIFNRQYGLPVDGYYIFEQETFLKMVDLIGGVDVDLAFSVTANDITYPKGVHTIDGAAALSYIASDGKISSDIDRFNRFQQVFTAALQRLFRMTDDQMTADVFQPLMMSSTPLRVAVDHTYADIVKLIREASKVPFESMTMYVIPGESAKLEGVTYYSIHRQELLALLNEHFNPYGDTISEGDLGVSEISTAAAADLHETKLSQWVLEQSGAVATTTAETTTTKAAA